jgi:hypothetical protein
MGQTHRAAGEKTRGTFLKAARGSLESPPKGGKNNMRMTAGATGKFI